MADSSYDSAQTPVAGPAIAPALGPYPSTASLPAAASYPGAVAKLSNGYVYQSVRGAWGQTTTSLIQKIKASIAAAQNNNPIESAPWLAAPLWVTAHAYGYGQVVTNAGNDYLLTTMAGGTSGATAPTGTGPSVVSDGALTWLYIGAHKTALPAYDAPATPTFTQSFTGISTFYYAAVSGVIQPYIRLTGGVPFVEFGYDFKWCHTHVAHALFQCLNGVG